MQKNTQELVQLLENYLEDITNLSSKFSNEFHILEREGLLEDEDLREIFKDLAEKAPKYTRHSEEKKVWPGFITNLDLLECAIRTKDSLAQLLQKDLTSRGKE